MEANCMKVIYLWSIIVAIVLPSFARSGERPNILFIFADDFAYDCVAATGNTQIKTPNIDRLVRQGTTFCRAYNMGSFAPAVCVSSRMMLNSGRFLWSSQKLHEEADQQREAGRWWSQYMKVAGYETYMTGKWHLKAAVEKSFDHVTHVQPGMPEPTKEGYNRPTPDRSDRWSPYDPKFGGYWEGGTHWSELLADDASRFLAHAAAQEKPFFMYLAFNAPHDPRQAPKEFVDRYPPDSIELPKPFLAAYPYNKLEGLRPNRRDESTAPSPRTKHGVQVNRSEYYAIITHLDVQVGRILDALEKTGKADETWIVFTADHGLGVGHHGLMGKQNMYDHSVRVPFVVVGPNISSDHTITVPIYLQDIMPTTLELAGVDKPDHVDFKSILPLLTDNTADHHGAIYTAYRDEQRAVTDNGYKLIVYPTYPVARLYHLDSDPDETVDLAGDIASKPIMKKLFAKLLELQNKFDDKLDLKSAFPEL